MWYLTKTLLSLLNGMCKLEIMWLSQILFELHLAHNSSSKEVNHWPFLNIWSHLYIYRKDDSSNQVPLLVSLHGFPLLYSQTTTLSHILAVLYLKLSTLHWVEKGTIYPLARVTERKQWCPLRPRDQTFPGGAGTMLSWQGAACAAMTSRVQSLISKSKTRCSGVHLTIQVLGKCRK